MEKSLKHRRGEAFFLLLPPQCRTFVDNCHLCLLFNTSLGELLYSWVDPYVAVRT